MHACLLLGAATPLSCGGEPSDGGSLQVPERYAFDSRFDAEDSVAYSGQTLRQVLIQSMKQEFAVIQAEIETEGTVFADGEVAARLRFYYTFDSDTAGSLPHGLNADPAPAQSTFDEISSGKNLREKVAGQDPVGQSVDWNTDGIVGWPGNPGPDALIEQWIAEADALAVAFSSGEVTTSPDGVAIPVWYVDASGRDYQQLLEKFLRGAVSYSQGTDDYLDDDVDGKGLRSDNVVFEPGDNYTALEHAWDEGFGYWGATRDLLAYDAETLADAPAHDHDQDGAIDLVSEYNFGAARNAAKRDHGAHPDAPTDLSAQTMRAFLTGRALIAAADGPLSETEFEVLQAQRDLAVDGWERAIAATALHYINDVLRDLQADATDYATVAKHWSELKGFTLALQFNPRMALTSAQFETLHQYIGDQVRVEPAYLTDLVAARSILAQAYTIDPANVGDELGEGGW